MAKRGAISTPKSSWCKRCARAAQKGRCVEVDHRCNDVAPDLGDDLVQHEADIGNRIRPWLWLRVDGAAGLIVSLTALSSARLAGGVEGGDPFPADQPHDLFAATLIGVAVHPGRFVDYRRDRAF